jgi:hypothetical protein
MNQLLVAFHILVIVTVASPRVRTNEHDGLLNLGSRLSIPGAQSREAAREDPEHH